MGEISNPVVVSCLFNTKKKSSLTIRREKSSKIWRDEDLYTSPLAIKRIPVLFKAIRQTDTKELEWKTISAQCERVVGEVENV